MKYINLKNTRDKISAVALGTDVYGTELDSKTSLSLLDEYFDLGGNIIDTASVYGGEDEHISEKLIGKWITEKKNRDKLFISTKGAHPRTSSMHIPRLSKDEINKDIEMSLKNLKTDYVDIYWLHRDDETVPIEPILHTLSDLVKSGKTRHIGLSNWSHKRIDEINKYAKEQGFPLIISSQIQFSLARLVSKDYDPTLVIMDDSEYDYFKNHDMSVFAYASQAKGFFSKLNAGGVENLSKKAYDRYYSDHNLKVFERIKKISENKGISIGETVIAGLVNNPHFQTIPIVGCKNITQLRESLRGADINISLEEYQFITKKF